MAEKVPYISQLRARHRLKIWQKKIYRTSESIDEDIFQTKKCGWKGPMRLMLFSFAPALIMHHTSLLHNICTFYGCIIIIIITSSSSPHHHHHSPGQQIRISILSSKSISKSSSPTKSDRDTLNLHLLKQDLKWNAFVKSTNH